MINYRVEVGIRQGASVWGPWQDVLDDAVAACTHHVDNLGAAVAGDVKMSRAKFRTEAIRLYELADQLVERCDDAERWLSIFGQGRKPS